MAHWVATISPEDYQEHRLYYRDSLAIPGPFAEGDQVVLVAGDTVFGLAEIRDGVAAYTSRRFDDPVPLSQLGIVAAPEALKLSPEVFGSVAAALGQVSVVARPTPQKDWLVSLSLPIEADSPAEAVRLFWTYVDQLGPPELPAFVSPAGDELQMRPYVLGAETELDPEEAE